MLSETSVRIDKWLWCVRLFKTRSLATDACKSGKVKMHAQPVKPSHEAKPGEIYIISFGPISRTVRVKGLLNNRVAAKLVIDYLEDLTPKEEFMKLEEIRLVKQGIRPRGFGRPTKKDRRDLEDFKDW
jgi:ribosome-associated heat shock protein Hsp15